MKKLVGKPVSQGIIIGKAQLFNSKKEFIFKEKIDKKSVEKEIKRFSNSIKATRSQLKDIYTNLKKTIGEESALIIKTQSMLLEETRLIDEIKQIIRNKLVRSEWAIKEIEKNMSIILKK